ncbi:MAG TPA: RodZ domain-containing protein [Thermoanaerobaculia bacterium]|nr:RodZ domain-containing protein [Thermoanaerobaculia bacterium]
MPEQEPQEQGGVSELASFGEELRREREIRGISLKEIADATKISKRFLEALERNDHRTLPAPVFTRGFVREYARYVGLNAEEMVNRYNFASAKDDRIEKPPQVEKYSQTPPRDISPKPARKRGIPPVYARVDRNLIAALFIAVLLAGVAYWAVQYRRAEQDVPTETTPTPVTPNAVIPAPLVPPKPVTDDSTLRLAVEVVENAWVVLEADGKTIVNGEMVRGERRTFEANDAFRFRNIGNAAGLRLTLNGATVPPLGADGEVIRNRVFDRDVLKTIRAEPADPQTQS